ncbi:conserved hypothetical protein [Ricinus communis]|uniref:Uncharacterized protein n=1 Tax=Ricinus communis TaxID=3988 RepID=B9RGF4_RICCO|nr:conserved hypothetical protein [Ricinus communis]
MLRSKTARSLCSSHELPSPINGESDDDSAAKAIGCLACCSSNLAIVQMSLSSALWKWLKGIARRIFH